MTIEKVSAGQGKLFFDDPYEALTYSITAVGKTIKEVGVKVFPGSANLDPAKNKLSRALTVDNTDVPLKIDIILAIMDETTPEYFINFLTDRYNWSRSEPPRELAPEEELKLLKEKIKQHGLETVFGV
jgi:hypothetical protein